MTTPPNQLINTGGNGTTKLTVEGERYVLQKSLSFENSQSKETITAFNQDCEIIAHLQHRGLPKLLNQEAGNTELQLTLDIPLGMSMNDFLDPKSARDEFFHVDKSKDVFDSSRILRWAHELAEIIVFLHSQRPFPFIHGNINPSTVWVTSPDEEVCLLDFGLLSSFHLHGTKIPVTEFSHPDLVGDLSREKRVDIYSFGKVLEFLLLRLLPDQDSSSEVSKPPDESQFASQLNGLKRIANLCCDLDDRFLDMDSVADELRQIGIEEPTPGNHLVCTSCGHSTRANARFCSHCTQRLNQSNPDVSDFEAVSSQLIYEDQMESQLLESYRQSYFAGLSRFRMMESLDEVESDPGFEELLSLSNLPDVAKMQHQKDAVLQALQRMRGRALLADEVGLGKTVEAGIFLKELLLRGLAKKILIVCPSTLLAAQWQSELYEKFGEIALVFGHDIDSSLAWHCSRLITTYDILKNPFHVEELLAHRYDLLILDEAHFLNDEENVLILDTVRKLHKKYFLMLSATPMHKSLRELYNIVTLLRPGHFADLKSFEREFIDAEDEMQAKNVETLRGLLHQIMIRNRREDITDYVFPKRIPTLCQLKLEPEALAFYNDFRDFLKTETAQVSNTAVLKLVGNLAERLCSSPEAFTAQINQLRRNWKVRQVLGENGLRKLESFSVMYPPSMVDPKLQELIKILKRNAATGERSLAFSQFDETARYFYRRLQQSDLKSSCFLYDPQSSLAARQAAVKQLEITPGGVLICPGEASEGLNLQFANLMVNLDLPWNPMKLEQRIGRIQRIGGKRDVWIFNLVLLETIEEKIYEICNLRIKMFEAIVGHVEEILGNLREEEDIQILVRNLFLDRHSITDEGDPLSAEENLDRALDNAEDKSSRRTEESLSYIYGSAHFDPSTVNDDEDDYY